MARYKILATIIVEGEDIKTEDSALNELSNMKECYDEQIADRTITISVKFINEETL